MVIHNEHAPETYKSLISISTEALKAFQWLNGGAVVAMLTYVGHHSELATAAEYPLAWFVGGLVAASAAFITSYLTQLALYNEDIQGKDFQGPRHGYLLWTTLIVAALSLVSFGIGAFSAIHVLAHCN